MSGAPPLNSLRRCVARRPAAPLRDASAFAERYRACCEETLEALARYAEQDEPVTPPRRRDG